MRDIVIGIPTKNEECTIIHVLNMVTAGLLDFFPEYDASILVADGNSTDRTIRLAESFRTPPQIEKIVMRKSGETGKGGAIRDIMRVASDIKANMLAIVDSDLISITPSWMDHLLRPIAFGIADFTTPRYIRDKHDGGVTKLLTYPMITTLFGGEIRQPMGGEVGLSSELIRCCLDHPLFPDDWGIDTFITFVALANGLRIQEAPLGPKFHESTSKYVKPSTHLLPMFEEVVITLFRMMEHYESVWKKHTLTRVGGARKFDRCKGPSPTPAIIDAKIFRSTAEERIKKHRRMLGEMVEEKPDARVSMEEWPEIVFRFASGYKRSKDENIIKLLGGLWLARYADFVEETRDMGLNDAEKVVYNQMLSFLEKRDLLVEIY